jgi:mono/diheme cytochrome c family protein
MKVIGVLAVIGALAIVGSLAAAIFFFGGYFNVAASHADPGAVNWALVKVRMASIARRANDRPPSGAMDDPASIEAGALAYAKHGCVECHGEPGVQSASFSEGLNPPPDLRKVITDRRPEDLFWVIKNGIKMSAMPGFGMDRPPLRDREIWSIVAFLTKLSSVSDKNFRAWTSAPVGGHWVAGCSSGAAIGCGPGRQ